MSIYDFHSKLVSGKEEGLLFEALRKLKGIESPKALTAVEPAAPWSVWMDEADAPFATAKA